MREIEFRGKRLDNSEWVYGYLFEHEPPYPCMVPEGYIHEPSKYYIQKTGFADWNMQRPVENYLVDPETIGQYTGLKDKHGKKIFEGDIVKTVNGHESIVTYKAPFFGLDNQEIIDGQKASVCDYSINFWKEVEIIGNIHEPKAERINK